jgi:ribosomal protein S7
MEIAMLDLMTKPTEGADERRDKRDRIRLVVDTEEVIRRAVRLRALRTGKDNSDVVNDVLREALADEITEASKFPHATGKKRGRKPKKGGNE